MGKRLLKLFTTKKRVQEALTFPLFMEFIQHWNLSQQCKYEELDQARKAAMKDKNIKVAVSLRDQIAALNYHPSGPSAADMRTHLESTALAIDARYFELVDADNDDLACEICLKYQTMIERILAKNPSTLAP